MSDIFREVDEDLRHEQFKKLWERYSSYVIGLAILIVVGTAGYRGWEYWRETQAQKTGDRFVSALQLASTGKHDEAMTALDAIAADGSGGYPILAEFRAAAEKSAAGNDQGAIAEYDAIAGKADVSPLIKNMARLRAAYLLLESGTLADLEKRIGDLAAAGNPWRYSAREILGFTAWRTGDLTAARKYFSEITGDQGVPQDFQSRANFMLALINAREGAPAAAASPAG
jgi:hypothetical protein